MTSFLQAWCPNVIRSTGFPPGVCLEFTFLIVLIDFISQSFCKPLCYCFVFKTFLPLNLFKFSVRIILFLEVLP